MLLAGNRTLLATWVAHLLAAGLVCLWLVAVCDMSLWLYVVAFALPGTSLMLIRSFCEHRADADVDRRTAIVEGRGPLSLLFLNNNLHAAHHECPRLAWYALPRYWRENRVRLLAGNGGLHYRGYGDVFARFLLRPHDEVAHPLGRAPRPSAE
jgi:fatty acid desaturase